MSVMVLYLTTILLTSIKVVFEVSYQVIGRHVNPWLAGFSLRASLLNLSRVYWVNVITCIT